MCQWYSEVYDVIESYGNPFILFLYSRPHLPGCPSGLTCCRTETFAFSIHAYYFITCNLLEMDRRKFPLGAHWFFLDLDLSFTTVSPVPPNFGQRLESELQNIHQPVQVGICLAGVGAAAAKVLSPELSWSNEEWGVIINTIIIW